MIASQQVEVFRVLDLVGKEKANSFDALLSSVDIITYEYELLVTYWETSDVKEPEKVKVLTVHIAKDLYGRL